MEVISAGITCYNARDTIERAVQSARKQTWGAVEIVVVDDCSTDGSWAVLERLCTGDERFRIVRHTENMGVGAARNKVLEHSTGAFVAFFDDDDASRADRLDVQIRRILEYERATGEKTVVCYSATEQVFPGGGRRYSPTVGMDATPAPRGEDMARMILTGKPVAGGGGACPTSSLMARRQVFELVGGFDEAFRRQEDTDLNLRLALAGAHFAGVSDPLVEQTMTFTGDKAVEEERRSAFLLLEKHRESLERWNWYEFSRRWTEMKYAVLENGKASAIPHLARLFWSSPVKLARKAVWVIPNRKAYKRFGYLDDSRG